MIRIYIVEDEAAHTEHLTALLRSFEGAHAGCSFEIRSCRSPKAFLSEYTGNGDLIFLDIQMPEMDGMQLAREIRRSDPNVMLIFITALAQYAIAGYEVQAFDYILKPVLPEVFEAKMSRALRVLDHSHGDEWIDISTKSEMRRIAVSEISFIEVDDHDILIHTNAGTFRHWGSLKEYEQKLSPLHFARCNSCYLVNMKHVKGLRSGTVLVGDRELAISRSKRKDFLVAFAKYKGGSL